MRALVLALGLGVAALVTACYEPTYEGLLCAPTAPQCPDGYACAFNNMCVEDRGVCGDGVRSGSEACDDFNTMNETRCPYGMATCMLCNADCTAALPLTGKFCGDGELEGGEENCDDRNTNMCGGCSADCQTVQPPSAATGMLMNVDGLGMLQEGRTFTLLDGVRIDRLTFEIDTDGNVTLPNIRVNVTASGGGPVNGVINAINASPIMMDAVAASPHVRLTNQLLSGRGNQPIETTIAAPFSVMGMSGGAGGDCTAGVGCSGNGDCFSNACTNNLCQ